MARKPRKGVAPLGGPTRPKPVADLSRLLPAAANSDDRICWRFGHVDDDGPWGLKCLNAGQWAELFAQLVQFESMTIHELFHRGDEPGKHYDVAAIPNPMALERLEQMQLSYMDRISRLRIGGTGRLYGFLHANAFHVVWWDPRHEVWPSQKRHT